MRRDEATRLARQLMDEHNLKDWKIHAINEAQGRFVGKCMYGDRTILVNIHHLDLHPDNEIKDTFLHEIAHALTPGHNHDAVWMAKAVEVGARPEATCTLALDPRVIEAIRSNKVVEMVVEEEVVKKTILVPKEVEETVQKVSYRVTRLQEKCPICGKVAKEKSSFESNDKKFLTLECGHLLVKALPKGTPFETIIFDGKPDCVHVWDKTVCQLCHAKRPYGFQIEGMRAIEKYDGRFGVFDEMGLGKTLQGTGYLKFHPEAWPFLYVCKAGLIFQAAKEIVRVLGPNQHTKENFIPYIFKSSKDFIFPGFRAYIISYDLFRRMSQANLDKLAGIIKCVVLDEVQHIKNPDSTRTQEIRSFIKKGNITRIIPLSGSHWKNRGSESYVACNLINDIKFHSFEGFKKRWVEYYWHGNKLKEGGLVKGFREYCADVFIRRERQEVMKELPIVNRTKLNVQMPKEVMEAYDEEVDKFVKIWNQLVVGGEEDSFAAGGSVMAALNTMRQLIGIAKIPGTIEFAQEFIENTERKLLIFVHHIAVGQSIYDQMSQHAMENDYKVVKLTSAMSPQERFEMQEQFNNDPNTRVGILSTLAAGEGLNLQTCSDGIMHERQWNPMNEEQPEGRMIRIGQKSTSVNMTYVQADGTCDEDLDDIVEGKRIRFHAAMNKGERIQWNQNSIIKELGDKTVERWRKKNRK